MDQAAIVAPYTYHEWPDHKPPAIVYKPAYQLPTPTAGIHSGFSAPLSHPAAAPLPFVYDPINHDYFCYEPETTCFVYFKFGRVYYDAVKREHYRPYIPQALNFSKSYPPCRVYQNGEVMFYDPRRNDYYAYDLRHRRIVWRDQRWWPCPQKFSTPKLSPAVKTWKTQPSGLYPTPPYRTAPVTAPKEPLKLKYKSDESSQSNPPRDEVIRVAETQPDNAHSTGDTTPSWSGKSRKESHKIMEDRESLESRAMRDAGAKGWLLVRPDSEDESYPYVAARRRGSLTCKSHKAGRYDLEALVAKSMRKKRCTHK